MTIRRPFLAVSLAFLGILAVFGVSRYLFGLKSAPGATGTAEDGSSWTVYSQFQGYQTFQDPEKIPDGAAPNGQNTTANHGDRISPRNQGYDLFPSTAFQSTTSTGVITMHTFRLRNGNSILMRSTSSTLEWYDTHGTNWEILQTGYQSGDFGYADNNVNTDQQSYTYFGNSLDAFSRWTGNTTYLTADVAGGAGTLNVNDTTGWPASGNVSYCGVVQAYTSKTLTSFTVSSAVACANGRGVAETPVAFTNESTFPRGNIYLFQDNRLWISGTTSTPNQVFFSGYGTSTQFDFTSLVSSSTLADPGVFNLAEGGGPVTALVADEGSIYAFKQSIIYKATLSDTIYSILPLKAYDGKSQSIGATSKRNVFATSNGVFFITPDNQIYLLSRVEYIDYPQTTPISEVIKPTVDGLNFASSTGIVFRDKAYFAVKSVADAPVNDTVLVYNLNTKAWDTPIVGWNVAEFAIYADQGGQEQLYFSDGTTDNTYIVTDTPNDYIYDTAASWRTKQYTFGNPAGQKYISNVFVEGYISPNTNLTISLLLDEDGYTKQYKTTLSGTETSYIYNSSLYNVFGFKPFGTTRFGSQEDLTGKKKFRIYLGQDFQQVPFYNASLEFDSDGANQQWEVTNYGFLVRPAPVPEKSSLYKSFK